MHAGPVYRKVAFSTDHSIISTTLDILTDGKSGEVLKSRNAKCQLVGTQAEEI